MKRFALSIIFAAAIAAFPGQLPAGPDQDHGHSHEKEDDHADSKRTKLRAATIGEWKVTPVALGDFEAGKEVHLDFQVVGPAAYPKALRAWIGDEAAEKTGKTRIDKSSEGRGHGHLMVPKELGEKDLLWVEVEDAKTGKKSRASVPLTAEEEKKEEGEKKKEEHGHDHGDGDHDHDHSHDHDDDGKVGEKK